MRVKLKTAQSIFSPLLPSDQSVLMSHPVAKRRRKKQLPAKLSWRDLFFRAIYRKENPPPVLCPPPSSLIIMQEIWNEQLKCEILREINTEIAGNVLKTLTGCFSTIILILFFFFHTSNEITLANDILSEKVNLLVVKELRWWDTVQTNHYYCINSTWPGKSHWD